jgi:excisionase family DNA binding protein
MSGPKESESITHKTQLLTVGQMAEVLQVPKSWLYGKTRFRGPGSIPRVQVGKYLRFEREAVLLWLRKQNEVDS